MEASISSITGADRIKSNIQGMKGWLKLLGIVQIVAGILQALTLFGIFWAWLPIWLGIILNGAANKAGEYVEKGDEQALAEFTGKLKLYFIINGVMMIISLAVVALALMVLGLLAILGVISLPSLMESFRD
ncbi:MAG: DUF5362 family protein [candidate division WOR-3 bacterium]